LDWLANLRNVVDEFPDRVLLGEVDTSPEKIAQFYGENNRPILHLPLNYRLLDTRWSAQELASTIEQYHCSLPEHGWPNWVIGSHDKKRIASSRGAEQARLAAMLFLTLPGTAIFYAGDELGMSGGKSDSAAALDPFERLVPGYGLNRDPERTPMQWSTSRNGGFTSGEPWLPMAPDWPEHNVEKERNDSRSILSLYRRLIALRQRYQALAIGAYTTLLADSDILAYERSYAGQRFLIVLNFGNRLQTYRIPEMTGARLLVSTSLDRGEQLSNDRISLAGNEGVIISLEK
jgi:alpha-glucosidase